jgi:hypothetical protein
LNPFKKIEKAPIPRRYFDGTSETQVQKKIGLHMGFLSGNQVCHTKIDDDRSHAAHNYTLIGGKMDRRQSMAWLVNTTDITALCIIYDV